MDELTVKELIEKLQKYPSDMPVRVGELNRYSLFANEDCIAGLNRIEDLSKILLQNNESGESFEMLIMSYDSGDFEDDGSINMGADFPHYISKLLKE